MSKLDLGKDDSNKDGKKKILTVKKESTFVQFPHINSCLDFCKERGE